MNPDLQRLQPYPFEKLRALFADLEPADKPAINLGVGEPKHAAPEPVLERLRQELPQVARYPATRGIPELRGTIASWLEQRYALDAVDAESQVLPVNGTREALFAFAQAVIDREKQPLVIAPNPFRLKPKGVKGRLASSAPFVKPLVHPKSVHCCPVWGLLWLAPSCLTLHSFLWSKQSAIF